ncbi:MAG: Twitching mobility protein [Phycisphaerae bacterium]|nr:Twitching mobility protein [Phycisphaerae bacterium]
MQRKPPTHLPSNNQAYDLLMQAVDLGASDLHLVSGYPPTARLHGQFHLLSSQPLTGSAIHALLVTLCPEELLRRYVADKDTDFSFELTREANNYRFRANYFFAQQQWGACIRLIPHLIPTLSWAGFPEPIAHRLAHFRNGLVLITGVAGSGKTTTLAMLIQLLNQQGSQRIITIEEPVEYVFPPVAGSIVSQREVGLDVRSFSDGLKHALRQDPNIILVGEIRDRETAQMALSAAETGHMVYATLHTRDAKGAISRLIDLFPQESQADMRNQLALSLRAVVSQHLLTSSKTGDKRALAIEVLYNNTPVSSAIRFGKIESIDNCILTGRQDGMVTLDESLRMLLLENRITRETALRYAADPQSIR